MCANGESVQQLLDPVPPYGFNYQYLNAIDSDLAEKAAIDPATQIALAQARRLNCGAVGTGGYLLYGGGGYVEPEQTEDEPAAEPDSRPQVIVVQVPVAAQGAAAEEQTSAAAQEAEPALPDVPAFVLVMRDGTQVKATAFTQSGNSIVYITQEGDRRTALLSNLDTEATVRLNGERGAQLQLSL